MTRRFSLASLTTLIVVCAIGTTATVSIADMDDTTRIAAEARLRGQRFERAVAAMQRVLRCG
jgi:hypothetical protein